MKRKTAFVALVLSALLLFSGMPAGAGQDEPTCLLGYWTTTSWPADPRPYCAYTPPPGNCVICYMAIVVEG